MRIHPYLASLLVIVVLVAAIGGAPRPARAQGAGAPSAQVQVGDQGGCARAGSVGTASPAPYPTEAWSPIVGDGDNNKDFDCIKVGLSGGSIAKDFRVGVQTTDDNGCSGHQISNPSWSKWASEGGGWGAYTSGDGDDNQNCARIAIQMRDLPSGVQVLSARVGVQAKNNQGQSSPAWSPWTASGGGMSGWAVRSDVHWVRVGLEVDLFDPRQLDAAYVATTIPAEADPDTLYGNASVTMRNTGTLNWRSFSEVSRTHECDSWNVQYPPQSPTATCAFTKVVSSPYEKLVRTDDVDAITLLDAHSGAPATVFPYERAVRVTYTTREVRIVECDPDPDNGPQALISPWQSVVRGLVPAAFAATSDPGGGSTPCTTTTYYETQVDEVPAVHVGPNSTAVFPLKMRTSAPGDYVLKFRMGVVRDGGPLMFGETAEIPVSVRGGSDPGLSLLCQAPAQVVVAGATAPYPVTVSAHNTQASSTVTVDASGLPPGATVDPRTLTVGPGGSGTVIMPVVTTEATPAGTSTLTFRAQAPGLPAATCTSQLVVQSASAPRVWVEPARRIVNVGGQAQYDAWYDPDGFGGQDEQRVTDPADWWLGSPGIATVVGPGLLRGDAGGEVTVGATYQGLSGVARLTVLDDQLPVETGPTLELVPREAAVLVGGTASFRAFYDPDGDLPGGAPAVEVTDEGGTAWSSASPAVASSLGQGRFRGIAEGTTAVQARYSGLTAAGTLHVEGAGTTTACTFSASPVALYVPPPKDTGLTWGCEQPTSCTITSDTDGGAVIGTGGTSGTVMHQPAHSTTYRLSCFGGDVQLTQRVRVFNIGTRIEIAPQ